MTSLLSSDWTSAPEGQALSDVNGNFVGALFAGILGSTSARHALGPTSDLCAELFKCAARIAGKGAADVGSKAHVFV